MEFDWQIKIYVKYTIYMTLQQPYWILKRIYHVMLYQTHLTLSVKLYRAPLSMSGIQTHNINGDFLSVNNNVVLQLNLLT
jgi:hypothetical protein